MAMSAQEIRNRKARYKSYCDEIKETVRGEKKGNRFWKSELSALLSKVGRDHAKRNKKVSLRSLKLRRDIMFQVFNTLDEMGYLLQSIFTIGNRHLSALFSKWEKEGLSAATLQSRHTTLQLFSVWIGKEGMVLPLKEYMADPANARRVYVAEVDKSWSVSDVLPDELIGKIAEFDSYVGMQLKLIKAFGLRRKEAISFRPHICFEPQGDAIQVYQGTKGGRYRVIPVSNEEQREVLAAAQKFAKRHSDHMGHPERSLEQNLRRFQYVLEKHGITRTQLGVTAHGLRHDYANRRYEDLVGSKSPLQGGDKLLFVQEGTKKARRVVAEELGHSRISVTTAYYGSNRTSKATAASKRLAEDLAKQFAASASPLDRQYGLIMQCLTSGLNLKATIHALATAGISCTETELEQWIEAKNRPSFELK